MALKTFVKVSGINNLSDARYCSGMEVNQLGFSIEPSSPNYTDPEKFKEIKGWLRVKKLKLIKTMNPEMEFLEHLFL